MEVVEEMRKYKVDVLGVSETKRKGNGESVMEHGYILRYSGVPKNARATNGVGVLITEELDKKVNSWEPLSSRIIRVDIDVEENLTIIIV